MKWKSTVTNLIILLEFSNVLLLPFVILNNVKDLLLI